MGDRALEGGRERLSRSVLPLMRGVRLILSTDFEESRPARPRSSSSAARFCALAALSLLSTTVLVVLPVLGSNPANVAAAAADPILMASGDIACGSADPNLGGGDPSLCQSGATANLIHSVAPNYLLAGGDTEYNPNWAVGVQPSAADYTAGYDATWGQLQNPMSSNYVPGLVVRPTPGDHEYGDFNENDSGPMSNASN